MPNTLLVRNTEKGPLVLSSDPKSTSFIEWAGAGDPHGNDVQPCPESFRDLVAFNRCLQRGILVEVDAEEAAASIDLQNKQWSDRHKTVADDAAKSIARETNNDIVAFQCVGPNSRGAGQCEANVQVRDLVKNDAPPLCSLHADLAPQFIPSDGINEETGLAERKWQRMTMEPRQIQQ